MNRRLKKVGLKEKIWGKIEDLEGEGNLSSDIEEEIFGEEEEGKTGREFAKDSVT